MTDKQPRDTQADSRAVSPPSAQLGLVPESAVVAYLYHDARTAEDAHPLVHSTMLVLAADRRPNLRNETPLVTLAQAEAMVAAERERCAQIAEVATRQQRDAIKHLCDGGVCECRIAAEIRKA